MDDGRGGEWMMGGPKVAMGGKMLQVWSSSATCLCTCVVAPVGEAFCHLVSGQGVRVAVARRWCRFSISCPAAIRYGFFLYVHHLDMYSGSRTKHVQADLIAGFDVFVHFLIHLRRGVSANCCAGAARPLSASGG